MIYLERRPPLPLGSFVDKLWYCEDYEANHRQERVLPNGAFQIVIDLAGDRTPSIVAGVQSKSTVIDTVALKSVAGVAFRPGGARAFFAEPADDFFNRVVRLDSVWGAMAGELRERLQEPGDGADKLSVLEAVLQSRVRERAVIDLHRAVRHALSAFHTPNGHRVLDVAKEVGLSRRRFAQLFREDVGLTPKLYCRLRRLRHVLRHIGPGRDVDWADVALTCGYYDQAHFAHEFREFAGMSPTAYLASDRPWLNHVAID